LLPRARETVMAHGSGRSAGNGAARGLDGAEKRLEGPQRGISLHRRRGSCPGRRGGGGLVVDGFILQAMDLGKAADRREILRRRTPHELQLDSRFLVPPGVHQRATERHPRGQIGRMPLQAGHARGDRILEATGAAIRLGKRRKCNRRRIQLDPASKIFKSRVLRHPPILPPPSG